MQSKNFQEVFEAYKDKLSYLQKVMLIFIGFSLFFFFMILLPYYSLKHDTYTLNEFDKYMNNTLLKNLSHVTGDANNIDTEIKYFVSKAYVNNVTSIDPRKLSNNDIVSLSHIMNSITNLGLRIDKVMPYTDEAQRRSDQLLNVEFFKNMKQQLTDIKGNLTNTEKRIKTSLDNKSLPKIPPTIGFAAHLPDSFQNLFQQEKQIRTNINNTTKGLIIRYQNLEAPIVGKIPVGFSELIAIFPITLSITFCFCTSILLETLRLRKYMGEINNAEGASTPDISNDEHISIVAPAWIDPIKHKKDQIIAWAVLIIPSLIFCLSFILIIKVWYFMPLKDTFPPFLAALTFNEEIYLAIYIVSFLLFGYCYWRIIREIKSKSYLIPNDAYTVYKKIETEIREFIQSNPEQCDSFSQKIIEIKRSFHQNQSQRLRTEKDTKTISDVKDIATKTDHKL
jgi:hypothetical protein